MKVLSMVLALAACVTGLIAAYLWWRSSQINVMPTWAEGQPLNPMAEPIIKTLSQDGWIAGSLTAIQEGSKWNKRASIVSGISVALSGLASVTAQ